MRKKIHKHQDTNIVIDLSGPDGNAFALLAYAKRFSHDIDKDPTLLIKQMMSSDYKNLIKVFEDAFGDFVTLKNKS